VHAARAVVRGSAPLGEESGARSTNVRNPSADVRPDRRSEASFASTAHLNEDLARGVRTGLPGPRKDDTLAPTLNEQHVRSQLRAWILEHSKAPGRVELTDQTPILETGLISSLDIVELVLFIEELLGEEVETDEIEPEVFSSVDSLWQGFFAGRS
jgi:acyl carrier protein